MRRWVPFILSSLVVASCGARTGLEVEPLESDAQVGDGGDAQVEGGDGPLEVGPDVETGPDSPPVEAGPRFCPLMPPMPTACPAEANGRLCAYIQTPGSPNRQDWCCVAGGWVNCTTKSGRVESCSQIVCSGTEVECVVAEGKQCCTCNSGKGPVDNCGGC